LLGRPDALGRGRGAREAQRTDVEATHGAGRLGSLGRRHGCVELTTENFDGALAKTRLPIIVDFWAGWCAPCKMMKPVMEAMAKEYSGRAHFAKVDVDRNQALARRYGVMSIPNFVVFKDGRPVDRVVGAVGRRGLEAVLGKHLT